MWEKCVGCGEGLFAGDAFCGNCGRPVTPAVPAAREPGGLESARLAAPAADRAEIRVIPPAPYPGGPPGPGQAASEPPLGRAPRAARHTAAPDSPAQPSGPAEPGGPARMNATSRPGGSSRGEGADRGSDAVSRNGILSPGRTGSRDSTGSQDSTGHRDSAHSRDSTRSRDSAGHEENAGRSRGAATPDDDAPGAGVRARPPATRLSGPASLDPVRNPRYLRYVLRQAGVFAGIYLLTETLLLVCVLLSAAAGTKLGPALRLEVNSLWLVALVLGIPFWLIPVPALLAEWSTAMKQSSQATETAFEHINSAFQAQSAQVDSLRVRTISRHSEGDREYLELRRDCFSGYISCFAHEDDLYLGWTFWLHMSPLRLLMIAIGRNIQDLTSRGDGIHRSLRFESTRALVAAMHRSTLAGIDAAAIDLDPADPQPVRETTIDMNFRLG